MKTLLLILLPFISFCQSYTIEKQGDMIYARPKYGLPAYSGKVASTIIQSAVNALTVPGLVGSGGGDIYLSSGNYVLSNEISVIGWEGKGSAPQSQIKISGAGYSTHITQITPGKNIFVVKNRASIVISNLYLHVGAEALSGIYFSKDGANSENSVSNGVIDNVYILSNSTKAPAFRAVNFFYLKVHSLDIYGTGYTNISLENNSTTTNFGNSQFNQVSAVTPNDNLFAGVSITSPNEHPMNLNNFSSLVIGAVDGYGQKAGKGLYINGGGINSFSFVDIEYMPSPVYIDHTGSFETLGNSILSGYLFPSKNGTAITCSSNSADNKFLNLRIEGEDTTVTPVRDEQKWRVPNKYELTFSGGLDERKVVIKSPLTPFNYTKSTDGIPRNNIK